MQGPEYDEMARRALSRGPSTRCFYVASHPIVQTTWKSRLHLCRALVMDKTMYGRSQDAIIPYTGFDQSTSHRLDWAALNRSLLLMGSGRHKRFGMFANLREVMAKRFRRLKLVGTVQYLLLRTSSFDAYRRDFFRSKFCLVVP